MNKRHPVTGDANYLGSYLCKRLLNEGCDVVSVDNYFSGNKQNIAHLLSNSHFEAALQDIILPFYIETGQIYNLVCPASLINHQDGPKQQQSNVALARERLNCEPNISVEDGLKETIAYSKKKLA